VTELEVLQDCSILLQQIAANSRACADVLSASMGAALALWLTEFLAWRGLVDA
jgi:hypothetical protein